jgi:hypothetical protein
LVLLSVLFLPAITAKAQTAVNYRFLEVVDAAGKPVANATVETNESPPVLTDEKGTVKNLPVYYGDFNTRSLKVSKTGYLTYEDSTEVFPPYHHRYLLSDATQYDSKGPIKIKLVKMPATEAERRAVEIDQQNREFILAVKSGDIERIRSLLRAGPDVQTTDSNSIPAVVWALTSTSVETINVLLDHGADLGNSKPGRKAVLYYLHYCFVEFHTTPNEEIVAKLFKAGADVNATDRFGTTSLKLVKQAGNANLIKQLERAGAQDK